MWKRSETDDMSTDKRTERSERPPERPERPAAAARPEPTYTPKAKERATIGPSISINGDLTGEEDLLIQGKVEGQINLKQHNVTIGEEGRVEANVNARRIDVEGNVRGDLHAEEQVVIRRSANVQGNLVAPRISLEDGCKFKGSVEMESATGAHKPAAGSHSSAGAQPGAAVSGIVSGNRQGSGKSESGTDQSERRVSGS